MHIKYNLHHFELYANQFTLCFHLVFSVTDKPISQFLLIFYFFLPTVSKTYFILFHHIFLFIFFCILFCFIQSLALLYFSFWEGTYINVDYFLNLKILSACM